jgi:hypothetical protein
LEGLGRGGVDPPQFEVASHVDTVKGAVGLSLEGLNVAVEVDHEVIPGAFLVGNCRCLHEERLDLYLIAGGGEDDPAFGLGRAGVTLVRSLMTSSMFQERPG